MSDISVRLSWAEILLAASVGSMRNVQSLKCGRNPGNGCGVDNTWTLNIEGAAGEMAVAKYAGAFWSGAIGDLAASDVTGPRYQVKTNTSRRYDDLILRQSDPDEFQYVLVLSFLPDFVICGWLYGHEGKQTQWLRDGTPGRPAFFVPRAVLRPIDQLVGAT